jgi:hypothetical protein
LVKTENKDCLLFNGRWAGLQDYRQSKIFIIAGTVIRLIMDVLMAINTSGGKTRGLEHSDITWTNNNHL